MYNWRATIESIITTESIVRQRNGTASVMELVYMHVLFTIMFYCNTTEHTLFDQQLREYTLRNGLKRIKMRLNSAKQ